jgi:arabinose-5-phosphate isomerase
MDKKAIDYACKNPKVLNNANLLASDALVMVEENKIQLLVITDSDARVSGVLHIHDLVEAGIK